MTLSESLEGFEVFRDEIFVRAQVSSAKSKSKLENLVLEKWRTLSLSQRITYAEKEKNLPKRKSTTLEEVSPSKKPKLEAIFDQINKPVTPLKNIKKEKLVLSPTKGKTIKNETSVSQHKEVKNDQFVDYDHVLTRGCPICKTTFKSVQNFSRHTKGKHSVIYINCRKCKMFFQEKSFKEHKCSINTKTVQGKLVQVNSSPKNIDKINDESKRQEQVVISQKRDMKVKLSPTKIEKIKGKSLKQEVEKVWPIYIDAKILKNNGCPECKQIIKSGKYSLHLMEVHNVQYKFKMKSQDGKIDPKYVLIKKPPPSPTSVTIKTEPVEQDMDVVEILPNPDIIKVEPIEQIDDIVEIKPNIKANINEEQTKSKQIEKKLSTVSLENISVKNKENIKNKENKVEVYKEQKNKNLEVEENLLIVQENLLIQEEQIRTVIFQTESLLADEALPIETDALSEDDPLCVNDENLHTSKDLSDDQHLNKIDSGDKSDQDNLLSRKIPVLLENIRFEIRLLLQEAKQKCLENPLIFSVEEDKDGNNQTEEQCEIEPDNEGFELEDDGNKSSETKDLQINMIEENPEFAQLKENPSIHLSNNVNDDQQNILEPMLDMEVTMDNDYPEELPESLDLNNYKNIISGRNSPTKMSPKVIFPNLISIASSTSNNSETIISNKNNPPAPKLEVAHPESSTINKDSSAQQAEYNNNKTGKTGTKTNKRSSIKNNNKSKTTKKTSDKLENLKEAVSDVVVYKLTPSEAVVKYKVTHSSLWMELVTNQEDRQALVKAGLSSEEEKKVVVAWDDLVRGLSGVEMMEKYESNTKELMEYVKFICKEAGREKCEFGEAWWLAFRKKHDLLWRKS